ncbi:MAG: type II toxin-antitoxin system VapC family toxin, partial [Bacteroidota bacterium]
MFLLDTHVLIWLLREPTRVSREVRNQLADPANDVVASAVSGLEISIKRQLGKLPPLPSDIRSACLEMGLRLIGVSFEDAAGVEGLPLHHRDPFDRLLVSQARRIGAVLVSAD